eukprot:CAMPEP_0201558710 /NCGR_PEP_ID=MMETSP0173_2-20130828/69526_1 /ASSEMBLY_ACC=CAM_ASM_000268 /TAXON_ID=218659 /ORGANISM="Vexillifera sp., Strain DIVA3 564/2" /LENGTH=94 /DNA_ID=CAMNT_0047972275 /DNA_START=5 /DNA_END=285 /DNA_ORIENTATION=-
MPLSPIFIEYGKSEEAVFIPMSVWSEAFRLEYPYNFHQAQVDFVQHVASTSFYQYIVEQHNSISHHEIVQQDQIDNQMSDENFDQKLNDDDNQT